MYVMSRRVDRLPIWLRAEPGRRRPRFTRETIAAAALAIADAKGFEAVSMRAIAAKLGAGTMTLYHYVRTKDDLVALMDDGLMSEVLVPDGELPTGWRAALTLIAQRTRAVFVRHPWALLSMQGALPGPNGMRHFEQCLAALSSTSLDRPGKLALLALVDDFVFGHVLRAGEARIQRDKAAGAKVAAAFMDYARRQIETGKFPETAALFRDVDPSDVSDQMTGVGRDEERFESGLKALLDGADRRMRAKGPSRQGRTRKTRA
jgi:AcrR family transcriptional regulator